MIYIAAPLFTTAERNFNSDLAGKLKNRLKSVPIFLPQEKCSGSQEEIFELCKNGVKKSKFVAAILDGSDADSGTCWEIGFAYGLKIPVIGIRTDFRSSGDDNGFNLMISRSCTDILYISSLENDNPIEKIIGFIENQYKQLYF